MNVIWVQLNSQILVCELGTFKTVTMNNNNDNNNNDNNNGDLYTALTKLSRTRSKIAVYKERH